MKAAMPDSIADAARRAVYSLSPLSRAHWAAYPWRGHCLLLLPLLVVVLYVGMTHSFWGEETRLWFKELRRAYPHVKPAMRSLSDYGPPTLYAAYAGLLIRALYTWKSDDLIFILRYVLGALFFAVLVTHLLKFGLGLPRPGIPLPPQPFSFDNAYASLPSGHTTAIVTAALPLAFHLRRKIVYIILALLVALVGFSRLWLGAHHPVDILAGMLVGSCAAYCIFMPRGDAFRQQAGPPHSSALSASSPS